VPQAEEAPEPVEGEEGEVAEGEAPAAEAASDGEGTPSEGGEE